MRRSDDQVAKLTTSEWVDGIAWFVVAITILSLSLGTFLSMLGMLRAYFEGFEPRFGWTLLGNAKPILLVAVPFAVVSFLAAGHRIPRELRLRRAFGIRRLVPRVAGCGVEVSMCEPGGVVMERVAAIVASIDNRSVKVASTRGASFQVFRDNQAMAYQLDVVEQSPGRYALVARKPWAIAQLLLPVLDNPTALLAILLLALERYHLVRDKHRYPFGRERLVADLGPEFVAALARAVAAGPVTATEAD